MALDAPGLGAGAGRRFHESASACLPAAGRWWRSSIPCSQPECRKRTIHAHFGFDDFADGCGACDVCVDADGWLSAHLPAVRPIPRTLPGNGDAATADAPVARGDWIELKGLGLCHVRRVHRHGKTLRADVELARDLSERSIDLRRAKWRRVERE